MIPMARHAARVLVAIATLSLVACTTTPEEGSKPSTTAPGTTTAETSRPSVPQQVSDPIDLRPHQRHPCALLTAEQTADLEFPPQTFEGANGDLGVCRWDWTDSEPDRVEQYVYVLDLYVTGDPLAANYREGNRRTSRGTWVWETFEPRTIRGLPAVVMAMDDPTSYCNVVVGTGEGQGFEISGDTTVGFEKPDLCQTMVTAAELIVDEARG